MKLLSKILIVGSLFVATTMSAVALDGKVFPSSMCQPSVHSSASDLRYYSGQLYNSGSGYITIQCPVVRDNATNVNGTASARINVRSNGAQSLSCRFSSKTNFGGSLFPLAQSNRTSSTSANANVVLNLDVNLSVAGGQYDIYCRVPAGGRIFSYSVLEF